MNILGIDFETTGLDPKEDRIIEVGAVLWQWETRSPLKILSEFILPPDPISDEITAITGITNEMLMKWGEEERPVIETFNQMLNEADYAMAHNAEFDKGFYKQSCKRNETLSVDTLWIDTKIDIVFGPRITTRNLNYLAAEMGFVNPFKHRAVFDVLTMLTVASRFDLDAMVARAQEPIMYVRALVSYDDRDKAKTRGYYWCAPQRIWWRSFKESDYLMEKDTCGFPTALLESAPEG